MELDDKNRLADKWLDAAMKQYSHSEPDFGLEERVLRRLRAAPEKSARLQPWSWWATAAVVPIVLVTLLVRKPNHAPGTVIDHPPASTVMEDHAPKNTKVQAANPKSGVIAASSKHLVPKTPPLRTTIIATTPKLEQFPSPEPLSEQEKILIDYANNFGREAVLLARAQTELLKREALEQKRTLSKNEITQQQGEPE
jgi:hypothetical protein